MESARSLPPEINELLARGGIILTGNQRAARTLQLEFDRQHRAEGHTSWQPPAIFAWATWLSTLWQQMLLEGHADRLLLNRSQELHVWRSVIATASDSDPQWSSLQSIDALASMAADAWQQLCSYRGQKRLGSLGVSADTRAFQRWAQTFTHRCKADAFLSPSELESAIATCTFSPAVNEILLIGFDDVTPAQATLLDVLRDRGLSIAHLAPSPIAQEHHLIATNHLDDELVQAALWLRQTLTPSPAARIAVIHPDIASERAEIDRVFRQLLAPELQDITADPASSPYEFSLGQALSQQPMIEAALKLLRWTIAPLAIENISHLLLSPYFISSASERHPRAEFDAFHLRHSKLLRPELDLPSFISQVEQRHASSLSNLLKQLHSLQREASRLLSDNKPRSFGDWADTVRELLQAAAWASATPDSSNEFQTRRKWESALDELATLDFEGSRTSFPQALDQLEQIAQRTLFAPESREAPIQIMSPLEAAGSRFDALYFLRASDLTWPTRPGMDPLLGWRLQRDLQMPGSDAAHDSNHARRIATRLASSAPIVLFSYARETAEAHQRPSPVLSALSLTELPPLPAPEPHALIDLEVLDDSAFIPLTNMTVHGGASVLQLQAACGFRAFAEKRLWSTTPESLAAGMDAAERGNIVHLALQHLWDELHSQANLRALPSDQRRAALARAINQSLNKVQAAADSSWDTAYLDIQRERLHRLLAAWLDVELTRPPFEVEQREQKYEDVAIGPLLLSLRVDRIDRVFSDTGEALGEVILDYKTGDATPSDWQTERPDEPQLPLYAAVREPGTIAAISFASLRPGKDMGMRGLAAEQGILPKPAKLAFATLEDQIADWHRILTSLAQDFADGDVRVRPKAYPITCEYCRQRILCRVDPTTLEDLNDEADVSDA